MNTWTLLACFLISFSTSQTQNKPRKTSIEFASQSLVNDTSKIYATKYVLEDKDAITNVSHGIDGAWNFWSDNRSYTHKTSLRKIPFSRLIKLDKSILDLSKLPLGYTAHRSSVKTKWIIKKLKFKD